MANKNVPKSPSITVCYLAAKLTGLVHKLHNTKITRYPSKLLTIGTDTSQLLLIVLLNLASVEVKRGFVPKQLTCER